MKINDGKDSDGLPLCKCSGVDFDHRVWMVADPSHTIGIVSIEDQTVEPHPAPYSFHSILLINNVAWHWTEHHVN